MDNKRPEIVAEVLLYRPEIEVEVVDRYNLEVDVATRQEIEAMVETRIVEGGYRPTVKDETLIFSKAIVDGNELVLNG